MGGSSSRTLTRDEYIDPSLYIPQSWTGMLEAQTVYEVWAKRVTKSGVEGESAEVDSSEEPIATLTFPSANWMNFMENLSDLGRAVQGEVSDPPKDSDYFTAYKMGYDKTEKTHYAVFTTNTGKRLRIDLSASGWSGSSSSLGSKTVSGREASKMLINDFILRYGPKIKLRDRDKFIRHDR